ncbi:MAG: 50S ribosomal protein L13 [Phycisphaerae bacterium]|nr:MAG: 50S ribosomal protein L13 [Planctomycetota bacterium]GJQ27474.1 MAG: 50S ribosomal protein L13 [Phycisphaerae bacterium]
MPVMTQKCFQAKPHEVERKWFSVDADGKILGRLATKLATVLVGKHKPSYTPHVDTGDFVVVTNVEKIKTTGTKDQEMEYQSYSYYPGGKKVVSFNDMMARHPDRVLREAVRRMMPKNALARRQLLKLKIYAGGNHPHQAQNLQPLDLTKI